MRIAKFLGVCAVTAVVLVLAQGAAVAEKQHVEGKDVEKNTERIMTAIPWQDDLESLKAAAAEKKKFIFWLQIVGNLDGGL